MERSSETITRMKIVWPKILTQQPRLILEEAGYHEFLDPNTGKTSYVQRIGREFYPRYHLYINRFDPHAQTPVCEMDIHIDQKQASYEGHTAHSGEYTGPLVEEEAQRLVRWLAYYSSQ